GHDVPTWKAAHAPGSRPLHRPPAPSASFVRRLRAGGVGVMALLVWAVAAPGFVPGGALAASGRADAPLTALAAAGDPSAAEEARLRVLAWQRGREAAAEAERDRAAAAAAGRGARATATPAAEGAGVRVLAWRRGREAAAEAERDRAAAAAAASGAGATATPAAWVAPAGGRPAAAPPPPPRP